MSEPTDNSQGTPDQPGPNFAGFLRAEQPPRRGDASQIPVPSDPPPPGDPEAAPRDLERSLVERIADVDDDRRRSANQMRKALETHREEVRSMRRRDRALMLFLAGLSIILVAALALLYSELVKTRDGLDARLATVEQRPAPAATGTSPEPAPAAESEDAPTRAELDELADAIEAIGDRLAAAESSTRQMREAATPQGSAKPAPASTGETSTGVADQIRTSEARMEKLLDERLILVKERIDRLQAATEDSDDALADGAPTDASGTVALKQTGNGVQTEQSTVVVQLAGFRDRAAIDTFIKHHGLSGPLYLRTESWRGRPWYALIKSLHANMADAETAAGALPPDLAKLDIWLRPLPAGIRLTTISKGG